MLYLIECLIKENKQRLAEKLIITLDTKKTNNPELIKCCTENHLFKSLLHLSFESDESFMAPLIKILDICIKKSSNLKISFEDIQDFKYRYIFIINNL